jgi:hypothetical protein
MANRYCGNCGSELSQDVRFCPSCGRPVHETAQVSTPEADVDVPPPPRGWQTGTAAPATAPVDQQGEQRRGRPILKGCLGIVVILFLLVVIGAMLGVLGDGGGETASGGGGAGEDNGQDAQQASDGQGSSGSSGSSENDPVPFGETAQNGDLRWTLSDVEQTDEIGDQFDSMSGNFVTVDFRVRNTGDQTATIDYSYLLLLDSQERQSEPSIDASMYVPTELDPFLTDISPGVTKQFRAVYEVAPDAEGFVLEATSENFNEGFSYLSLGI